MKINGKNNFIIDILYADQDYHSVFIKEQELIKENIHDNRCLNQQYQDTSTGKIFLSHGYKHSEETKRKIQASQVGKHNKRTPWNKGRKLTIEEKSKQNILGLEKGRAWNKGIKTGIEPVNKGKPSPHKGTKNLKNAGRFWTNNGETELLSFDILPGFSYGRLYKRKPK
ncbi:Nuclease associated modular domain 3 [uncultured Caudovirales phage]|uniref:Nuclease associated modular domain 3 n=1 Tax=uncultured Caudovirales phage TaxID=2100421 RepID=A0A6J5KPI3_9CAUD|nr:Nuclease associated modular domain 3 [uncultured Caudovirales phage]